MCVQRCRPSASYSGTCHGGDLRSVGDRHIGPATLTAPSFGPVHRRPNPNRPKDLYWRLARAAGIPRSPTTGHRNHPLGPRPNCSPRPSDKQPRRHGCTWPKQLRSAPVLHFGQQLDARPIVLDAELPAERAAGYLAKYVTKGTEDAHGALRQARAEFKSAGRPKADGEETVRDRQWRYAWQGWPSDTIAEQAAGIREELDEKRGLSRQTDRLT